ncbi:glycogen debranching N-terminal domain-containing protein [Paenarthrobacter sp. YIM B13468]
MPQGVFVEDTRILSRWNLQSVPPTTGALTER